MSENVLELKRFYQSPNSSSDDIAFYLDAMLYEIKLLRSGKFTGNIQFGLNCKDGYIGNMNVGLNKCVKMPEKKG